MLLKMKYQLQNQNQCTLESKIGEGSFGDVYKISYGDRKYALKIEKKRGSLERESRLLRRLCHPSIPRLVDSGSTGGYSYLVIPLFHVSLIQVLATCPSFFTPSTVCSIGLRMLCILRYLHREGLVYVDVKPENIMIGYNGRIYLIDFGMCREYRREDGRHGKERRTNKFVGTVRYASVNSHREISPSRRDDVESLGYTLIFLLRGTLPWVRRDVRQEDRRAVGALKEATTVEELARGLAGARHWEEYMRHARGLGYEEEPKYQCLKGYLIMGSRAGGGAGGAREECFIRRAVRWIGGGLCFHRKT